MRMDRDEFRTDLGGDIFFRAGFGQVRCRSSSTLVLGEGRWCFDVLSRKPRDGLAHL